MWVLPQTQLTCMPPSRSRPTPRLARTWNRTRVTVPGDFTDWGLPVDLYFENAVHTAPLQLQNLEFRNFGDKNSCERQQ